MIIQWFYDWELKGNFHFPDLIIWKWRQLEFCLFFYWTLVTSFFTEFFTNFSFLCFLQWNHQFVTDKNKLTQKNSNWVTYEMKRCSKWKRFCRMLEGMWYWDRDQELSEFRKMLQSWIENLCWEFLGTVFWPKCVRKICMLETFIRKIS